MDGGRETDEPGLSDDPLTRLDERLDRASEAAERLIAEAAAAAVRRPPPAGWQQPNSESPPRRGSEPRPAGEFELLFEAMPPSATVFPPELQHRLGEALREVLLAVRALIDWYLERTQRRRSAPAEVQDIPIF